MFCKACGRRVEENTKFCPYCGAPQSAPPAAEQTAAAPSPSPAKKKGGKGLFITLGALAAAVAVVGCVLVLKLQPGAAPQSTPAGQSGQGAAAPESPAEKTPDGEAPGGDASAAAPQSPEEKAPAKKLLSRERSYDGDGQQFQEIAYLYRDDGTLLSTKEDQSGSITHIVYNKQELPVLKEWYRQADGGDAYRELLYGEDGQPLGIIYHNADGTENSRETLAAGESYQGSTYSERVPGWYDEEKSVSVTSYDENGNILEITNYYNDEFSYRETYFYDEEGKCTGQRVEGDMEYEVAYSGTTETDSEGRVTDQYDYQDGELAYETHYRYYDTGYEREDKAYWMDYSHTVISYDMEDRPLEEFGYGMDGEQTSHITHTYDDAGQEVLERSEYYDENGNPYGWTDQYTYDAYGNVTEHIVSNYGYQATGFNTARRMTYAYEYDEAGNVLKRVYNEQADDVSRTETTVYEYQDAA